MPHRPFGNVRKLPSGRFQARYLASDGKERRAPETFASMKAARAWLAEQATDQRRGRWVDPEKGRETFSVYADRWMHNRPDLQPRTRELYSGLLRLHVNPGIGPIELGRIDVSTIRSWHAGLLRSGTGQVTVAKAYRLARTILNTAVADGLIVTNPCALKSAGVEKTAERPTATVPEVYAIADAIRPWYRALVIVAAFSSLRFGELAGLRWEHVDFDAGVVNVRETAVELASGERVVGPPKSPRSRRTVALPPQALDALRAHREQWGHWPHVFAGPTGAVLRRGNFAKVWKDALNGAGLSGYHFHDLRHTGNTLAAATGASTRELMARMGHASPRAALIYQHATDDRDKAIAMALGELIQGHSRHA